ncbi:hypothetical protein ACFOOK_26155 [Micromonospora krabiensis]|uniref:Uncharacterized protein n=1 Tax=Micromonospora krabiensis TaxID=307121 RepID=A0A1C3N5V4_9ACTN|nr:hypothetical protein [Micromonospora krabiensis]SBV27951.1 hypothetical protein GA0070620_3482 [Micromonospora krabiensis]
MEPNKPSARDAAIVVAVMAVCAVLGLLCGVGATAAALLLW